MLIDFIILITNITVVISAISRPVPIGATEFCEFALFLYMALLMGSVGKSIVDFYGLSTAIPSVVLKMAGRRRIPHSALQISKRQRVNRV